MAELSSPPECLQENKEDMLELNNDLESMIENAENISVQLTWMTYDMAVLRTSPELGVLMKTLEEACDRCTVAVYGERDQEPERDGRP
ncbi:synaptonemal complex central element protein 3 [Solea senegalensis]|uniref:Synaptonemal complex central element protein 3 n=1 Tax=Solea senegalensis TaxID=28829 RepID=A0AAV6SKC1_SOLSE|nr:synaptonemal complex central element protein 3 [Solea senegalensis]KAG7518455.1 synaptonemal complex central element protein 3 [Solea senegalensis]